MGTRKKTSSSKKIGNKKMRTEEIYGFQDDKEGFLTVVNFVLLENKRKSRTVVRS